jgi:hypothetical protein
MLLKSFLPLLALSCCGAVAADPLAHPLKDFARVVIADDASPVQRKAAEELAHFAGGVRGRPLEVVPLGKVAADAAGLSFYVGDTAAARVLGREVRPWKREEWLIESTPEGVALAGDDAAEADPWSASTRAGSMLAVYTLLEDHLGVHWFWPGEFGEQVPSKPDATVPALKQRQTPAFEIRSVGLGYSSYHTKTFHQAARVWARRSRLAWARPAVFGHSWYDAFNLRNDESFKAHPDWFALVKGKRRPPQMCTTHPEVIERMVQYVLAGKADIMNISPSDGGSFCECERCTALDVPGVLAYDKKHIQLSDRIFTYANEVARRVREKNPEKGCGMFAYTYYNRPPLKIAKLEPNLYLSFVYQSASQRDPAELATWRASVEDWRKLGARMVVREGWGNHYYFDLPFLHPHQIIDNLAEAHRRGFVAAYGEGSKNFATMAPNYWALTRMMWDPARAASQVMDEFYTAAYGPVAAEMRAFFEAYEHALDANWSKRDRLVDTTAIAYANIIGAWGRLIPAEAIEEAERNLRTAEAKVPEGEFKGRVKFHRLGQDYTRVMMGLLNGYRDLAVLGVPIDTFTNVAKERRDAPAERDALLKRVYELGEERERLLLAHRDWAGPDEGLYGFTVDRGMRQWHAQVKQALGIEKPSSVNKASLAQQR